MNARNVSFAETLQQKIDLAEADVRHKLEQLDEASPSLHMRASTADYLLESQSLARRATRDTLRPN